MAASFGLFILLRASWLCWVMNFHVPCMQAILMQGLELHINHFDICLWRMLNVCKRRLTKQLEKINFHLTKFIIWNMFFTFSAIIFWSCSFMKIVLEKISMNGKPTKHRIQIQIQRDFDTKWKSTELFERFACSFELDEQLFTYLLLDIRINSMHYKFSC